jgi:hypothetical protein
MLTTCSKSFYIRDAILIAEIVQDIDAGLYLEYMGFFTTEVVDKAMKVVCSTNSKLLADCAVMAESHMNHVVGSAHTVRALISLFIDREPTKSPSPITREPPVTRTQRKPKTPTRPRTRTHRTSPFDR